MRLPHRREGLEAHGAAADGPRVVLFEEDRSGRADDGAVVGEDLDDVGPPLDLGDEALRGVGGGDPGPVIGMEGHAGEDVVLRAVHHFGETPETVAELVGHFAPLFASSVLVLLDEHGLRQRAHHAAPTRPGMGQRVAEDVESGTVARSRRGPWRRPSSLGLRPRSPA
jgi:hypothetical protein